MVAKRCHEREWMGVEPTTARSARPVTGFEDRGIHRDTTTPKSYNYHYNQSFDLWQNEPRVEPRQLDSQLAFR